MPCPAPLLRLARLGPAGRPRASGLLPSFARLLCGGLLLLALGALVEAAEIRGLPFSRVYSLEDIGYVPRGSRLGFDVFGRVAVIHDGVYAVLNDTTWLNLADVTEGSRVAITQVVQGPHGQTYYGGLGSWGRAEILPDGKLHARPLNSPASADWTQATTFEDILVTADGVYFASRSGVVFWDPQSGESQLFPLPRASKTFRVGDRIYVSCFSRQLQYLDVKGRRTSEVAVPLLNGRPGVVVERATQLDERRTLLALLDGRLLVFDGQETVPWPGQLQHPLAGRITALQQLADGNLAVSVAERGVFVFSAEGDLLSSLTIPQYHRVSDIASREPGVMWLINEDSIEKILYGSGLTGFGQRLGMSPDWPLVGSWNGQIMAASAGVLFSAVASAPGTTTRFERLPQQPPQGAWSLAAWGPHLLVGNATGLYSVTPDGRYLPLASVRDLSHLVMVAEGLCYAIGPAEIALFVWNGERWTEPAPRIAGVRSPSLVHRAGRSAWIEMGGEGIARVSWQAGQLQLMLVHNATWTRSLWVNVGVIDDTVVLGGNRDDRRFFSERTGDWVERPDLNRLLNRSPEWLARVRNDAEGNLWASYNEGVVRFTPQNGDYEMDALTYDLINDRYPIIHVLPDNEVWIAASRSLYHVEKDANTDTREATAPVLVSLADARQNVELWTARQGSHAPLRFPYDRNSLTFRLFSGSYAWRRTPQYEFRLNAGDPWVVLDTGSILRFPGLHEGSYRLQVRLTGVPLTPGAALTLPFEILPPWHRTWPAFGLYASLAALAVFGAIRWSGQLARKRNRALELLVQERTGQLESTMGKLNEETRITATLAERNRLAGEIHDSVQQGLSGAILQLDTTLTLTSLTDNLRARLNVVRNMVSYARQEVQHAVWNLDSPLLEGNDLGAALRKLATFVTSDRVTPSVELSGPPVHLPRAATHHLLRIAQEATTNALRHAHAHTIVMRLEYQPESVVLEIADDGDGFQPDSVLNQAGHFGLRGIRVRAKKLRGALSISSAPGTGTRLRVVVPLAAHLLHDHDPETRPAPAHPHLARR